MKLRSSARSSPSSLCTVPRSLLALVCLVSACAHETPEQPFSLRALEVDPALEAAEVERTLREAGFVTRARIEGRGFVALAAELPPNTATAVRVITKLGTILGVDAPDHATPLRRHVALLAEHSGRDLDGDGTPELLIELLDDALGRCIAIARVMDDGRVLEVPLPTSTYGATACAEDARNVLGDARPELLVRYRAERQGSERIPTVHVPFVGQSGMWGEADRSLTRPFYESERAAREMALLVARSNEDEDEVVALEAEKALLDALLARVSPEPAAEAAPP
jgi:hypothetical protein